MTWIIFALLSILFNAAIDIVFKILGTKIHPTISGLIVNLVAVLPVLVYYLIQKSSDTVMTTSKSGLIFAVLAGLLIGFLTITMLKVFSLNAPLSVAIPFIRITTVIISIFAAALLFHEPLCSRFYLGALLALTGFYFIFSN